MLIHFDNYFMESKKMYIYLDIYINIIYIYPCLQKKIHPQSYLLGHKM